MRGMVAGVALVAAVAAAAGAMGPRTVGHSPGEGQGEAGWKAVEQAFGRTGTLQPGGVFRIAFPRDDLDVRVASVRLEPSFALGSYAAFMQMGPGTNTDVMMMGDLALRDEEVPGVMARLFEHGIDVTALHNHLNEMSSHVMYMHFGPRRARDAGRLACGGAGLDLPVSDHGGGAQPRRPVGRWT
jgi:hypothetical protein